MNRSATALADLPPAAAPPAQPATVHGVTRPLPRPLSEDLSWARAAAARSGFGASEVAMDLRRPEPDGAPPRPLDGPAEPDLG